MKLILFRHGLAADPAPDQDDASRPLTDEGVRKTAAAARGLATLIDRPDFILTSPRLRAVQTAHLLAKALDRRVETLAELGGTAPGRLVRKIKALEAQTAVLVGHEPMLSTVVQMLCTGRLEEPYVQLKKAGCACVQWPVDAAEKPDRAAKESDLALLLWLATPAMLRAMGKA
jgi:phosphohistidine phosphatase